MKPQAELFGRRARYGDGGSEELAGPQSQGLRAVATEVGSPLEIRTPGGRSPGVHFLDAARLVWLEVSRLRATVMKPGDAFPSRGPHAPDTSFTSHLLRRNGRSPFRGA